MSGISLAPAQQAGHLFRPRHWLHRSQDRMVPLQPQRRRTAEGVGFTGCLRLPDGGVGEYHVRFLIVESWPGWFCRPSRPANNKPEHAPLQWMDLKMGSKTLVVSRFQSFPVNREKIHCFQQVVGIYGNRWDRL
jgi:hypothetical protein